MSQFVYILQNRAIDQGVRIINTDKDSADLPKYLLYSPGVRPPFTVFMKYTVADAAEADRRIDHCLGRCRSSTDPTLFGIDTWQAASMLDDLLKDLIEPATPPAPYPQRQDELLSAATQIAISMGTVWPSSLAGPLSISFEEAQQLLRSLQARGVINSNFELCPDYLALHIRQEVRKSDELAAAKAQQAVVEEERRRQEAEQSAALAAGKAQQAMAEQQRQRQEAEQSAALAKAKAQPQATGQEQRRRDIEQGVALAKANPELVQAVNRLLDGLVDPETGEAVEIRFVDDNGRLAVDIRGTEWVRLEAEKRLSVLYDASRGN
jgi:hypothetical protein